MISLLMPEQLRMPKVCVFCNVHQSQKSNANRRHHSSRVLASCPKKYHVNPVKTFYISELKQGSTAEEKEKKSVVSALRVPHTPLYVPRPSYA